MVAVAVVRLGMSKLGDSKACPGLYILYRQPSMLTHASQIALDASFHLLLLICSGSSQTWRSVRRLAMDSFHNPTEARMTSPYEKVGDNELRT